MSEAAKIKILEDRIIDLELQVDEIEEMQEFAMENLIECLAKLNGLCELLVIAGKLTQQQMEELEVFTEANKDQLAMELIAMADENLLEAEEEAGSEGAATKS